MLDQPTAEWMPDWQTKANPRFNAQPRSPAKPAHSTDANFSASAGLAFVFLIMFSADTLQRVDLEVEDLQCPCHKGNERSPLITLEGYPRVAEPTNILNGQVDHKLVLVTSLP